MGRVIENKWQRRLVLVKNECILNII